MSEIYVTKEDYSDLLTQFTKLQKQIKKIMKTLKKDGQDETTPKKLMGFAKPTKISEELALFLNIDKNELISRTQVTKLINTYIKENDLKNPENKREIIMNEELKQLLNVPDDTKLSFFNLQRYIKHHYPKIEEPTKIIDVGSLPAEKTESVEEEKTPKIEEPTKIIDVGSHPAEKTECVEEEKTPIKIVKRKKVVKK